MNPLSILGLKVLGGLAAVGVLLWGVHTLDQSRQKIGYDRRVAEDNAELIKAREDARTEEQHLKDKLETARNDANKREIELRNTTGAARVASERLRVALDALRTTEPRKLPGDPTGTPADATATLAELLGVCTDKYRGVAEAADRHASDARTLSQGWPK